jgi:hypothetical protein
VYTHNIQFKIWKDAGGDIHVDERFAYPKRDKMIISSKIAALVTVLPPIAIYLLVQTRIRNIDDARASVSLSSCSLNSLTDATLDHWPSLRHGVEYILHPPL